MSGPDGFKQAWQAADWNMRVPPLPDVRRSAAGFDRRIRLRNAMEYVAGLLVIVFVSVRGLGQPTALMKVADGLIVAGCCLVLWQLARRASVPQAPTGAATSDLIRHYRANLARQRDALRSVWLWYLLPLAPGLMLSLIAPPQPGTPWLKLAAIGVVISVFAGIQWLNRKAARHLQKEIDVLDSFAGELE
jgi:hypothetical protein